MGDFEWALVNALNSFFEKEQHKSHSLPAQSVTLCCAAGGHTGGLQESRVLSGHRVQEPGCTQNEIALFQAALQLCRRQPSDDARDGFHHPLRQAGHTGGGAAPWRGKTRTAHLVPWGQIFQSYDCGKDGHNLSRDRNQPSLGKERREPTRSPDWT